jgi:putative acetyltransferase
MNTNAAFALRRYEARDEEASIALWHRTWQAAYPQIDFAARLEWWRKRWREELLPVAEVAVAEILDGAKKPGALAGFVTVDPKTLYLDQLVVAPEHWRSGVGALLVAEARRISPRGLDLDVNIDNARAIGFYVKQGFSIAGEGKNPLSGKPVHRMSWRP